MTRKRSICAGTMVAALTLAASGASAQTISDARIKELVRQATERLGAQGATQTPAAPQGISTTRPTVPLTLDDAVKAALDHNLDIAVQRLNPEIQDISYASLRSVYRPTLTSTVATNSTSTPANNTLAGGTTVGAPVETGLTTFNAGINQSVPWYGGSFAAVFNNNKSTTTSLNTLYNPTYNTNWNFTYTQPLLKNFTIDNNRQGLSVSRINRDISDVQ